MRFGSFVPWLLVSSVALGGSGVGVVFADSNDPSWPPPEGASCKPSKKETDDAKTLYQLGNGAYQTANYADAIKYWRDAYKRDCTAHVLLKNLGRAFESDGQWANAVDAYKLFRARQKPTGDELDTLDQKIANLQKKIPGGATTDTGATTSTTSTGATTPTTTSTGTTPTSTATSTSTSTATAAPTGTSTAPPSTGNGPGATPWIVTGVGGGVALIGGILWIGGNSKVSSKATQRPSCQSWRSPPTIRAHGSGTIKGRCTTTRTLVTP